MYFLPILPLNFYDSALSAITPIPTASRCDGLLSFQDTHIYVYNQGNIYCTARFCCQDATIEASELVIMFIVTEKSHVLDFI